MNIAFWLYFLQKFTWFWQRLTKIWIYFLFFTCLVANRSLPKEYPPPLFTAFTAVSVAELLLLAFCRRDNSKNLCPKVRLNIFQNVWTHTHTSRTCRVDGVSLVHSLQLVPSKCPRKCDNMLVERDLRMFEQTRMLQINRSHAVHLTQVSTLCSSTRV